MVFEEGVWVMVSEKVQGILFEQQKRLFFPDELSKEELHEILNFCEGYKKFAHVRKVILHMMGYCYSKLEDFEKSREICVLLMREGIAKQGIWNEGIIFEKESTFYFFETLRTCWQGVLILLSRISQGIIPCVDMCRDLGNYYYFLNLNKIAIKYYKKVVGLEPDDVEYWDMLGELYEAEHQLIDALYCYREVVNNREEASRMGYYNKAVDKIREIKRKMKKGCF